MPGPPGTGTAPVRNAGLRVLPDPPVLRDPLALRALTLLLALGLGGLMVPLAHEIDHLLDAPSEVASHEASVAGHPDDEAGHDCALCDVRFNASSASEAPSAPAVYALPEAPLPVSTLARGPTRAFSGRAPPVVI